MPPLPFSFTAFLMCSPRTRITQNSRHLAICCFHPLAVWWGLLYTAVSRVPLPLHDPTKASPTPPGGLAHKNLSQRTTASTRPFTPPRNLRARILVSNATPPVCSYDIFKVLVPSSCDRKLMILCDPLLRAARPSGNIYYGYIPLKCHYSGPIW